MAITMQNASYELTPNPPPTDTELTHPAPTASKPSRYEQQKKRDWRTFLHYLMNHQPPLTLDTDFEDGVIVIEFLKHFDQFGKTKLHVPHCPHFGDPHSTAPVCECPLKQAWGSLDALIGRLRAAYEENGGSPESNPFGVSAVRLYLRDVKDAQAKSRGIETKKKKRKPISTPGGSDAGFGNSSQVDNDRSIIIHSHGCSGSGSRVVDGNSGSDSGVGCRQKSVSATAQVDNGRIGGGVSNRLTSSDVDGGSDNARGASAGGNSCVTSNFHACTGVNIVVTYLHFMQFMYFM